MVNMGRHSAAFNSHPVTPVVTHTLGGQILSYDLYTMESTKFP